jgi:deoxyribonuclease-4
VLESVVYKERVGVCFDICHAYIAGYDLASPESVERTFSLFDEIVGLERVKLLHANDTDSDCGSHLDRHQNIGEGKLSAGFSAIVNHPSLLHLPCILETPTDWKNPAPDIKNLSAIRSYIK